MKTIEVIIVRRTEATYHVQVPDDFDTDVGDSVFEDMYFNNEFGEDDLFCEEVLNWDVDFVGEIK